MGKEWHRNYCVFRVVQGHIGVSSIVVENQMYGNRGNTVVYSASGSNL